MNMDIPNTLGEIFDRTIKLIARTTTRNLIVGAMVLLPMGGIFGFTLQWFIGNAFKLTEQHIFRKSSIEMLASILPHVAVITVVGILLFIASIFAQVAMMRIVVHEFEGVKISWTRALNESVGERWLRGIGVTFLKSFLLMLVILLPVCLIFFSENLFAVVMFTFFFIGIPCCIYFAVSWGLTLPAIVRDDVTVLTSMKRSWNIIHGQWWRMFGLFVLLGFSAGLAVSIVGWPLNFIVLSDFWSQYFQMIVTATQGGQVDDSIFYEMFSSLGIGYGMLFSINLILTSMLESVYYIVLYESAKRRKDEIQLLKHGITSE